MKICIQTVKPLALYSAIIFLSWISAESLKHFKSTTACQAFPRASHRARYSAIIFLGIEVRKTKRPVKLCFQYLIFFCKITLIFILSQHVAQSLIGQSMSSSIKIRREYFCDDNMPMCLCKIGLAAIYQI